MPISTGNTEETVYKAVKAGWLSIKEDGSVWRVAQRYKSKNGIITIKPVEPHRIDASVGFGYRSVKLMVDGKQTSTLAHRLVYHHFYGKIPPGLTINHINGKKYDNHPTNLELATYTEQSYHARNILKVGRLDQNGTKNPTAKLTEVDVREIRKRRASGEKLLPIANDFGIAYQTVSKIARGDSWSHLKRFK